MVVLKRQIEAEIDFERGKQGGVEKERQIGGGQEVYSERQRGRKIFRERGRELKTAAKTIQEMFDGPRERRREEGLFRTFEPFPGMEAAISD